MMEGLITGTPASTIFRKLLTLNPSMGASGLGGMLFDEFPKLSPAANTCIRRWMSSENRSEYPDEQIDAMIKSYLEMAGYL